MDEIIKPMTKPKYLKPNNLPVISKKRGIVIQIIIKLAQKG